MTVSRAFALLLFASVTALAAAQTTSPVAPSPKADNYYAAGNRIDVSTPMLGDVVVAGRQINITQPVAGDVLAAGWQISLSGRADDDVRMAGGTVTVNAPVNGDLTIAGGDVAIGSQAHVTGRSWITGNVVRVEGVFDRELQIAGATVQIAGEMRKPVRIAAERLDVLPTARILAPLAYKAPAAARIADGATVTGPVTFTRIEPKEARDARSYAGSSLLFAFHLTFAGLLLLWLLPQFTTRVVDTVRTTPGRSVLLGAALLITVPVVALTLIVTVLALPIGLTLAALYCIGLFVGVLAMAFYVADLEARLFKRPVSTYGSRRRWLIGGVVSLAMLRAVPVLGTIVVLASVVFGLGALALATYATYRETGNVVTAP